MLFGMVAGSISVSASTRNPITIDKTVSKVLSEKQLQVVEITNSHTKVFTDSQGNKQMKIIKKEELQHELDAIEYPLNAKKVQMVIDRFNQYIIEESGNTHMKNKDGKDFIVVPGPGGGSVDTSGFSCGDILGIIGLIHGGAYGAAALALGITGPVGLIVPLLISTAYTIGSVVCD